MVAYHGCLGYQIKNFLADIGVNGQFKIQTPEISVTYTFPIRHVNVQ